MTETPPFEIIVEGDTLRASLRGHWDVATAEKYVVALSLAARSMKGPRRYWLMDLSDFPVQSPEVAELIGPGVAAAKAVAPPVVALVGNSALGAMQGRRVGSNGPEPRFRTSLEARAWLEGQRRS